MMVCHCMRISDHDIRSAVGWMRASDPQAIITPGRIYRAMGRRADCGGCMTLFLETMRGCEALAVDRAADLEADTARPQMPVLRVRRL